jgi:hypothetical protein
MQSHSVFTSGNVRSISVTTPVTSKPRVSIGLISYIDTACKPFDMKPSPTSNAAFVLSSEIRTDRFEAALAVVIITSGQRAGKGRNSEARDQESGTEKHLVQLQRMRSRTECKSGTRQRAGEKIWVTKSEVPEFYSGVLVSVGLKIGQRGGSSLIIDHGRWLSFTQDPKTRAIG